VDLKAGEIYESRAVVAFLLAWQPQRFLAFLKAQGGGMAQEEALQKSFGVDFAGLEQRWRDFVLKSYEK